MKTKKFFRPLGTTAACVRRMVEAAVKFQTKEPEVPEVEGTTNLDNGENGLDRPFYEYDDIDEARRAARAQGYLPNPAAETQQNNEQTVSNLFVFVFRFLDTKF